MTITITWATVWAVAKIIGLIAVGVVLTLGWLMWFFRNWNPCGR